MAPTPTPTTTQPEQQQQRPPARPRLTIRELQERRRKAQEAYIEAERLAARWNEELIIMDFVGSQRQLEEEDRAMERAVEAMREGVCNPAQAAGARTCQ